MLDARVTNTGEPEVPALKLAVLIDADNAQPSVIDALLAEVARFGEATIRRIYGDFTAERSRNWKQILNKFSINPIQQFAYTTGKNATDSRLIIDAMDLLHKGNIGGFCLVSSDSDFTGLASRIREEGLVVYGFGEHKTPEAFRNACHKFVFTENLRPLPNPEETGSTGKKKKKAPKKDAASPGKKPAESQQANNKKNIPLALLKEAVENTSDDTGWANLGPLGTYLIKRQPDFDCRSFGFKKLTDLFMALPEHFECKDRASANSSIKKIYIRLKSV